jgi:transposase-like protein
MAKPILSAEHFQNEEAAFAFLEARIWPNGPVCPKCDASADRIKKLGGKTTRIGLHKCYACMKPFTVKMGTVFESSHVPLHLWLQTVHLMVSSKKGISTNQIHRTMGVTLKTAWFMAMRIREAMKAIGVEPLGGAGITIEGDETYIGGKAANRAFAPVPNKQAVVALVERNDAVRSFHVANVTADLLYPLIARQTHADSRFMTDESGVYSRIGRTFKGGYQTVNHSAKEYVRDDAFTNSVEGYFSILKRGVYGVYHHVSEAHLHRYLAEFDFRYSNRIKLGVDDKARTDLALKGAKGKRLTYRTIGGRGAATTAIQAER